MTSPGIIEAAINGTTRKSMNPNVPIDEDELVADACGTRCDKVEAVVAHDQYSLLLRTAGNHPLIQVRERSAWVRDFPDMP